jgi:hypothetical protein
MKHARHVVHLDAGRPGKSGSAQWINKTPKEMLEDIRSTIKGINIDPQVDNHYVFIIRLNEANWDIVTSPCTFTDETISLLEWFYTQLEDDFRLVP